MNYTLSAASEQSGKFYPIVWPNKHGFAGGATGGMALCFKKQQALLYSVRQVQILLRAKTWTGNLTFEDSMNGNITLRQSDVQIVYLPTESVKTCSELENIFTTDPKTVEKIRKSMLADGFHPDDALTIAQDKNGTVIGVADGNTRLMVAKELAIPEVPVMFLTFENLEAAIIFAKGRQLARRNLSQAEIYRIATTLDTSRTKNRIGRATEKAGADYGISPSTLEHARTVEKRADEETKNHIKNNQMTINQAYQKVRKKKKKNEETDEDDTAELSDSLDDMDGKPRSIFVRSRDMGERLADHVEESDYDRRMIERYREGKKDGFASGFQKGISEGTYLLFEKIKNMLEQGATSNEILNDELFADFSYFIISTKLDLPASNEKILEEYLE